jgi:predicted RNA-binding protein YlxR (DUF448 family)
LVEVQIELSNSAKKHDFYKNTNMLRTCVFCKQKQNSRNLLRITALPDGILIADWHRNLGGRGAYVCLNSECIKGAYASKAFNNILKQNIQYTDMNLFVNSIQKMATKHIITLLGSALSKRVLSLGTDSVNLALKGSSVHGLLIAGDFSYGQKFIEMAESQKLPARVVADKETLGRWTGHRPVGIAAITHFKLADAIIKAADRWNALH